VQSPLDAYTIKLTGVKADRQHAVLGTKRANGLSLFLICVLAFPYVASDEWFYGSREEFGSSPTRARPARSRSLPRLQNVLTEKKPLKVRIEA
jgi:hypothetical protein